MDIKQQLLAWIEQDREEIIQFLSEFVSTPSPNPPGDTTAAAQLILQHLQKHQVPAEVRAAKDWLPNIVGSFQAARPGRHLVLNGHIDVFPAGDSKTWSRDPWSGAIEDGKIHGRGVVDMKCGTAASIWTYIYLYRIRERLAGKLALTCVSDEETGGTWGAKWLIETFPTEFAGDCMLNGEPSVPNMVRFGEKGTLRVAFEVNTPGAHAAYTHLSDNAIKVATALIHDLYSLENLEIEQAPEVRRAILNGAAAINAGLGQGASDILNRITVCVGVIQGGIKINIMPGHCRMEVDIRMPVGATHSMLIEHIERIMTRYPLAKYFPIWTHSCEPTYSPPDHEMMQILKTTVTGLGLPEPAAAVSLGATDSKHWRQYGVPAYVYGCRPTNMAKADEQVEIEEYLHIVRTHVLAAAAYLDVR